MSYNQFWNLFAKKLSGEATKDDLSELEKLMKSYPELLYSAQHIEDLWKLETTEDIYKAEEAYQRQLELLSQSGINIEETEENVVVKERKGKKWIISAILLVIGIILLSKDLHFKNVTAGSNQPSRISQVFTKPGSKIRMVLPDSSIVWLNSGSKISYNNQFGVTDRNVMLEGEAYFDVKHNRVPFIIHTESVQIKVLGTEFNVRSYPTEKTTETSLIRGRVEIRLDNRPEELYILKPNEKLVVKNNRVQNDETIKEVNTPIIQLNSLTHTNDSTIEETSWVYNKLVFQDESFKELANKIERWYGVTVIFKDRSLEDLHFTGVFEKETVQQALEALQITANFHFSIKNNLINIYE